MLHTPLEVLKKFSSFAVKQQQQNPDGIFSDFSCPLVLSLVLKTS